jgi:hypothetical protein
MLAVRSPARETLRRGAPRRQIKDGNGAVIRLGAPAPMVKRPLTRIAYSLGLRARPLPPHGDQARDFATVASVRLALDTLEPPPTATVLLSAQEANERVREIVEGFFFWRLRTEDRTRIRRLLVKSPPGLGKTTEVIDWASPAANRLSSAGSEPPRAVETLGVSNRGMRSRRAD